MRYFIKSFLVLSLLLLNTNSIYSQVKKSKSLKKAELAFESEQYHLASDLFKKAYKKAKSKGLKAEIIFKQAQCFRMSGNTKRAETFYKRAIKSKYPDVSIYLIYADMLRLAGEYDDAANQYRHYLKLNPSDVKGELGLKSCEYALKWNASPTRYLVEIMPSINTRYNDYSPMYGNSDYSELYFSSSRDGGVSDKIDDRTGEYFTDIYTTKIDKKGKWSRPNIVPDPISLDGSEGSAYINKRGTIMFFTKCKVEKKQTLGCSIYVSKRKGKLWGQPMVLQVKIDSNTTIGHPAVNEDESLVIFSSDLSGGYGGKDLWIVHKEQRGKWSLPLNLGPAINTSGDEMFPFLHDDGTLYFSSTGHIGLGGLDVFKSEQDEEGGYVSVVNMKVPVNSSSDDFGFIVEGTTERGYLTSNRDGGKGGDDIYWFELPPLEFILKGVVTDSKTGAIMTSVTINLINSEGITVESITDNTGQYEFKLSPLTSYEIIVNHKGYLKKIEQETTVGIENSKTFIVDLPLDPVKKEIILPLIQYDFNKYDLRAEAIIDLDKLVEALLDNPNVVIELKSHTDFVGSNAQNNKLSQQRADVCVAYLINKGIDAGQLVARGMGEKEPFVIEVKDGRFKEGDVLTESYIKKIRFKKNKEKAHQYNRRTSFKVLREDYIPENENK
ncbi:OmpA family protein [Flavobacteriales bacterium]|nr:OmpA family protein [Flavobacteriales bacterium]